MREQHRADVANDGGTFERMFGLEFMLDLRLDVPVERRRRQYRDPLLRVVAEPQTVLRFDFRSGTLLNDRNIRGRGVE